MPGSWLAMHALDLGALLFHVGCFVGYRLWQRSQARRDPTSTLQAQQAAVRAEWVAEILRSGNGILGVQTLRNALMATLFFASNTMFLLFGVLTLTAQAHFRESWALFGAAQQADAAHAHAAQIKLLFLLLTLLAAFFCFISAVRLFSHASVSITTKSSTPERVTAQIDNAWSYQGLGVRFYYFAAPLLCWLFGALWLVVADLGVLALMYAFDSAPGRD